MSGLPTGARTICASVSPTAADILSRHVQVLTAREACDRLVVGLSSDASVVRLGARPAIQNVNARAHVLALEAVDLVVVRSGCPARAAAAGSPECWSRQRLSAGRGGGARAGEADGGRASWSISSYLTSDRAQIGSAG